MHIFQAANTVLILEENLLNPHQNYYSLVAYLEYCEFVLSNQFVHYLWTLTKIPEYTAVKRD